jgi:polysaccharide chain length determinant protein (PEP-CTERM system associated)
MTEKEFSYRYLLHLVYNRKHLFAFTAFIVMTGAVLASYLLPKIYESSCTVFIEKKAVEDMMKGIALPSSNQDSARVLTHALRSRTLISKVINEVDFNQKKMTDASIEVLIGEIIKNLNVTVNEKELFVINFKFNDPRIARDFVNTLVRKFIEQSVASSREESSGATQFLSEQITLFKDKIKEQDAKVNEFKEAKAGIVNLDEGAIYREVDKIEEALNELLVKRKLLEEQKKTSSPQQLKLVELKNKLKDMQVVYTENFPEVRNLKSQIETLQAEIASRRGTPAEAAENQELIRIEAELKAVKERESYLQKQLAEKRGLLHTIPATKTTLKQLQENSTSQKNMYDLLNIRQQQTEVSKQVGAQDFGNAYRIVDPAVAAIFPVSPKRTRIMLMGIAAGFAAGFGLLLLLDNIDQSVRQIEPLRRTGLPIMAVIPLIRSESEVREQKKSDVRFFLASIAYFSLILMIVLLEAMKVPLLDKIFNKITLMML